MTNGHGIEYAMKNAVSDATVGEGEASPTSRLVVTLAGAGAGAGAATATAAAAAPSLSTPTHAQLVRGVIAAIQESAPGAWVSLPTQPVRGRRGGPPQTAHRLAAAEGGQ